VTSHNPTLEEEPPTIEHSGVLTKGSRLLLAKLSELDWVSDLYLAGSAATALYVGHRRVRNVDIMGYRRLVSSERRDMLQDLLQIDGGVRVETARDGFFYLRFAADGPFEGAGLRLFYYPYPLVGAEEELGDLAVASALDLGLMKLGALISRGHRRDFLDLFLLCRKIPLAEMLERSAQKYGHVRDFRLQALKGLADVSAARAEPMPKLELDVDWSEVEAWLLEKARPLARSLSGLGR